jgi:hypothetical protein
MSGDYYMKKITEKDSNIEYFIEMSKLTFPGNLIDKFEDVEIWIRGSGDKSTPVESSLQEHNPPHFHIVKDRNLLDVAVAIKDLKILSVLKDRNKTFKKIDKVCKWETSGQLKLKKAIISWLKKPDDDGILNYKIVIKLWNLNNPTLDKAVMNIAVLGLTLPKQPKPEINPPGTFK